MPLTIYREKLLYSLGPNSFLFREYKEIDGSNYRSLIETDEWGFSHNGNKFFNEIFFSEKKENEIRIIFMGGSTTFGTGATSNNFTVPAYVEKILKSKLLDRKDLRINILNAGVIGYTTYAEFLYLKNYLIDLNPDLLIFLDGSNDPHIALRQEQFKKEYHSMAISKKTSKNLLDFPQKLYLLNLLSRSLMVFELQKNKLFEKEEKLNSYYHVEAAATTQKNIEDSIKLLLQKNIKSIFYLQPNLFTKKNLNKYEVDEIASLDIKRKGFSKNFNLYYRDLISVYKKMNKKYDLNKNVRFDIITDLFDNYKTPIDFEYLSWCHVNNNGNKIIAEKMSEHIINILNL